MAQSVELLLDEVTEQAVVEEWLLLRGAGRDSHFGPGRFTPHVTLARRMTGAQVGSALDRLTAGGRRGERTAYLTRARRWDGDARRDWLL